MVRSCACGVLALVVGLACKSSPPPVLEDPPIDASFEKAAPPPCPAREPRSGIACEPGGAAYKCSYEVGTCAEGDGVRTLVRSSCCSDGAWHPCGASPACDVPPEDAAADSPEDVAVVDAAPDGGSDGPAEAPTCGGALAPASCDGEPCQPCAGGASVPCACLSGRWFCQVCPADAAASP